MSSLEIDGAESNEEEAAAAAWEQWCIDVDRVMEEAYQAHYDRWMWRTINAVIDQSGIKKQQAPTFQDVDAAMAEIESIEKEFYLLRHPGAQATTSVMACRCDWWQ